MSEPSFLPDRYFKLIDEIVQTSLKGDLRSKDEVYQLLIDRIKTGTGEIFERCLSDRLHRFEQQVSAETDELQQASASRHLAAVQTIQSEWNRWQAENQSVEIIAYAIHDLLAAAPEHRLKAFLRAIDPNRDRPFNTTELRAYGLLLERRATKVENPELQQELSQLGSGVNRGLDSWLHLQENLVGWLEDPIEPTAEDAVNRSDPWIYWANHIRHPFIQELFRHMSTDQLVADVAANLPQLEVSTWVELVIILHHLQQNLITWFDRHRNNPRIGAKLAVSTFLTFAMLWSHLAKGFEQAKAFTPFERSRFSDSSFQITIQTLRIFSQRSDFPFYGRVFSSFPGNRLRNVIDYLKEPLKQAGDVHEKARILTLVGLSTRSHGLLDQAKEFHDIAREMAADAGDQSCQIANLNHLSRTCAAEKNYAPAIHYSQHALILSRELGDLPGEANALVNWGYGTVFQAYQREQITPEVYEAAINALQPGLMLATAQADRQSLALGYYSGGIAYLVLDQPGVAIDWLIEALKAAQAAGELYLQGLDLTYLAEAYHRLQKPNKVIYAASIAMYYLDRINSRDWRHAAGLLTVLQGQMGEAFAASLEQQRMELVAAIGMAGYEHIPKLLQHYRHLT
jgi:tetratricopeptide (TPR) repeat protein